MRSLMFVDILTHADVLHIKEDIKGCIHLQNDRTDVTSDDVKIYGCSFSNFIRNDFLLEHVPV